MRRLESEIAMYLGVPYATVFTNGHTSLEIALEILDLKGEVITTPYTFVSTTLAILRKGLKPVFCDIKEDYTLDEDQVEAAITERTCAILPVHVYGNLCNVEKYAKISDKYDIPIIYDAAHAFGVKRNGVGVGSFGSMSMFSFHATKVFNTVEGGALTYNDIKLQKKLEMIRNFGISEDQTVLLGTNAKMSEIHAAMGLCNLRHIDESIARRGVLAALYNELLGDCDGIILNKRQPGVESNYAYYPIRINQEKKGEDRNAVVNRLEQNRIYARKYYSPLMTNLPLVRAERKYSLAQKMADEVIALPLNTSMSENDVKRVCNVILGNH